MFYMKNLYGCPKLLPMALIALASTGCDFENKAVTANVENIMPAKADAAAPVACKKPVGTLAVSIVLPCDVVETRHQSIDSEVVSYASKESDVQLTYARTDPARVIESNKGVSACSANLGGDKLTIYRLETDYSLLVSVADPLQKDHAATILLNTKSSQLNCEYFSEIISTLRFVNAWDHLAVLSVTPDKKQFTFSNEIGEKKTAAIGDVITRNEGKVLSISNSSVMIEELVADSTGGFTQIQRELFLRRDE